LLSTLGLWILKLPLRSFLPALSLPNSGNAGLPIVYFAFPEDGLTIGVAFFFMIALVQYTVVPAVVAGHFSLRKLAAEPLIWSIAAVVLLKLIDVSPHRIIADTTRLLSGIMIPVMLILLGGALARLRVADLKLSLTLSGLRFIVGIAAGYGVIVAMDLQGIEAGAIFLLAAMPSALVTYVFAERYGRDPERVAGMVVSSTVLTFAALPILVALALNIAGQ
ncbi:MAG: AEC family transporter, partial [Stappiaceae bacterium]